MKNRTATPILALLTLFLTGCGGGTTTGDIPTLDLEAAIDNPRAFDLAEIAEKIEFISLDGSSTESLVGNINLMAESKNMFYISEGGINPVQIFDKVGKFVSTRGTIGRGPGEFLYISSFATDYARDIVYLKGAPSVISYDTDGRAVSRNDSIRGAQTAFFDDELVVLQGYSTKISDGRRAILEVFAPDLQHKTDTDVIDKGTLELLTIGDVVVYPAQNIMFGNGNSLFVKETLCDTVFRYENGRALEPAYRLDAGRYFVPAEAFGQNPAVKWSGDYHEIADVFDGDKRLIVKMWSYLNDSRAITYLVLDKSVPRGGFAATDSNGKPGLLLDGIAFTPAYVRDNLLVGWMQAIDIVDNAEAITDPQLKALAATLKEDSNPVIVVATLKK